MDGSTNKKRVSSFFGENENVNKVGGNKLNDTLKRLYVEINKLNLKIKEQEDKIDQQSLFIDDLKKDSEQKSKKINELIESNKSLKELNLSRLKALNKLSSKNHDTSKKNNSNLGIHKSDLNTDSKSKDIQPIDKIALFTAINSNYIEKAITCFKSYEIQNPDKFDFYIITGNSLTKRQQDLCTRNRVKVLFQNLHADFKVEENWPYPSECFWIFKGPEIFYNLGYKFSMSVDADTFCVNPLQFNEFKQIKLIGGAMRLDMLQMKKQVVPAPKVKAYDFIFRLEKDVTSLEKNFGSFNKESYSINSGVLIYNNQNCHSINFYKKMVDLYKKSKSLGFARKGDDSLLSMFISLSDPSFFKYFSPEWNYYYLFPDQNSKDIVEKVKIIHMIKIKPWRYDLLPMILNTNIKRVIEMWRDVENKHSIMKEQKMKLWWYRPQRGYNFGDEITPWLFKKMYDVDILNPSNPKEDNVLLGVGSIMRLANENTEVWGSGIRNIDQADFEGARKFHAVRGPFSRKRLLELGMQCPRIYGDPGLLLPTYYFPKIEKKYELGIVPHLVDREIVAEKFARFNNVKIIDLDNKNIEDVVDQFLECKHIVSTSLHGLITAVAYGIPVKWLKASNNINGDDIKFYDFWASLDLRVFTEFDADRMTVDIEKYQPVWLDDVESPSALINKTNLIPITALNLKRLIEICPFH
jgi:hypothetical protein